MKEKPDNWWIRMKSILLGTDFWYRRFIKICSDEDDSNDRLLLANEEWVSSLGKIPLVSKDIKAIDGIDESQCDRWLSSSLSMIVWSWGGRRENTGERRDCREVLEFLINK